MRELSDERAEKIEPLLARAASDPKIAGAIDAILEAMFLMAAADGEVSDVEVREFARSCRKLVGEIGDYDVEGMFLQLSGAIEEDGWERRVRAVAQSLEGLGLAETAFRLAVSVAIADDFVAAPEVHAMDLFAEAFGVSPERAHELIREVHTELFGGGEAVLDT